MAARWSEDKPYLNGEEVCRRAGNAVGVSICRFRRQRVIKWKLAIAANSRARRKAWVAAGKQRVLDAKFEDLWRAVEKARQ